MIHINRDWLRRAVRTFLDSFLVIFGVLIVPKVLGVYTAIVDSDGTGKIDVDLNAWGKLLLACLLSASIATFNAIKNRSEDATGKSLIIEKHP